jgi:hypothetical protein
MDLKTFREKTKHLPDDTDIVVFDGVESFELHGSVHIYPPVLEHPHLVLLDMGGQVDLQFELDIREPTETL